MAVATRTLVGMSHALLLTLALSTPLKPPGKTYLPRSYWRFEDSFSLGEDTQGHYDLTPGPANDTLTAQYKWQPQAMGGVVGGYLELTGVNTTRFFGTSGGPFPNNSKGATPATGITVEMLVRFDRLVRVTSLS